jgi:DNA-binding transcriptional regulator YhcF (GntR family)
MNSVNNNIAKSGIAEQEEAAVVRQRRGKHISVTTNQHATLEELSEAVCSMLLVPRLYS